MFTYFQIITNVEIVLNIYKIYLDTFLLRYKLFRAKVDPKTQKFLHWTLLLKDFIKDLVKILIWIGILV